MSERSPIHTKCPPDYQLEAYLDESSSGERAVGGDESDLQLHLDSCLACQQRLELLRRDNALLAAVGEAHVQEREADSIAQGDSNDERLVSIPGYEILCEIQRGGQGVVYKANQQATHRVVALKVLPRGAFASVRQRQRFEREIDLAARLQHPGIVTVFDSGVAPAGDHYFAMEYIEGVSLDQFMRSKRGTQSPDDRKSVEETLRLFAGICEAIHYAHQRGVIHRDLKPSNIRIDSLDRPHILDFGLAKVWDPEQAGQDSLVTLTGEFMGTLAYASPEQTRGDPTLMDVRTDVYSLGVILYEMLTGQLPYRVTGTMAEVIHSIAESDPVPPSSWYHRSPRLAATRRGAPPLHTQESGCLAYKLNSEIETIVLKALSKDKARRYQSAEDLRRDIERYLTGEPIEAKRDSTWYVLQKTVRRHKAPVSIAALLFFMVTGFLIFMVVEKRAYASERDETQNLVNALMRLIESADPLKGGRASMEMMALLDRQSVELDESPPRHAEHEAARRDAIGHAYMEYRQFDKAEHQLEIALQIRREILQPPNAELADTLDHLGEVYYRKNEDAKAEPLLQESLDMYQALVDEPDPAIAESLDTLGLLRRGQSRFTEAQTLLRRSLKMRRDLRTQGRLDNPILLAVSLNNLGNCLAEMGKYHEAEGLLRESLDVLQGLGEENDLKNAMVMTVLGRCLTRLGRYEEAAGFLDRALEIKQRKLGSHNSSVAWTLHYQAHLQMALGNLDAAEQLCRQALAIRRDVLPSSHRATAASLLLLGRIRMAQNDPAGAEQLLRQAFDMLRDKLGDGHYHVADAQSALGECLTALGRFQEAEPPLTSSYTKLSDILGPEHRTTRRALNHLVELYQAWRKPEKAAQYRNILAEIDQDTATP